ncbi:sigma-70 family RNA polymerase sigma factor [bacterium]|uniref:sigma-70 family RNA polymerase sigma factor n=1 Tax=Lachnospiraceae TaxID=186803 RepID=UPI002A2B7485|nr:sigma-70 family RNA polymerase sigma factor [bacterium]MDY2887103.1 sigma-70 family RNA polymerase sigma factor [Bariatricus sp.]MCI7150771.1 sigma-70 family RNA polymerase sigma factor [bacterium]MDD6514772.1 sigma-70 family RNA polymerase sigma factor [bacterium]MDD7142708.1 sigma-70 family RNA polymerase sigma factor [bacterium]
MEYEKMTDEQLISRLRGGEKPIMDFLMEKYKGLVRQKAKAMYLWGGENDDLIQEGMIGLFKAVEDYEPDAGASFYSFAELCISRQMYTAIKASQRKKHLPLNSYVSLYTSGKREDGKEALPLAETIEAGAESNPEELLLNTEYANAFEEELKDQLSKLENRVLYLHLMGMDYLKIAEVMDKSPKAIDNALQRIKGKARHILEEKRK